MDWNVMRSSLVAGTVLILIATACLAVPPERADHVEVLTGPARIWTSDGDILVSVIDEQPEPKEHVFVLQRRGAPVDFERSYNFARLTYRQTSLEVVAPYIGEGVLLRLVPEEMLHLRPRLPGADQNGLIVGFGLSHHQQPVEGSTSSLFQQSEDPSTGSGGCTAGGPGASQCSIGCGGGRDCSVTCTFGYACCNCVDDTEPSCRCKS